ncbi:hypothetical protein C1X75_20930 [Pseudomonas sp. FW305-17]|nr:hypothetical protein C1X79_19035 [Pseudomonas sp. FW305-42]PNA20775.1 hypothetical protein C1X78_21005 [Pseudomonas sp. MPR-R1B]PNB23552.1 hypothetical protein C1X80_18605 [Pseudomonas sp. DP16D-E2]PNB41331.1 hypothetical protein C1X75_20930 [Pseudomonas sp. FW305-17]PNB59470.1 hypothetical protein C1X77_15900 [Pseudomonas sp. GW531-E2]PNB65890.1 hypothetical protein C1X76_21195 [Pseudomonas sp. FW305-127]
MSCICRVDSQITVKDTEVFQPLMQLDTEEYGQQFPSFAVATKDRLQSALALAEQGPPTGREYEKPPVPDLDSVRPSFDEAYGVFHQQAEFLIGTL